MDNSLYFETMKRVALHTLGCKLNYAETSTIGQQFTDRDYSIVDSSEPADVFVLNTCSVTERADRECRQIIRRALRTSPEAFVVVVGCYAQLEPTEIAAIEGVDLVVGAAEKFQIFNHLGDLSKKPVPQVFVSCIDEVTEFTPAASADADGRTRAFLKIQDGCDYLCTFCTIPLARGESRSMPVSAVLAQANLLASQGYKEIVLTGVNVGEYGKKHGSNLYHLLMALEQVEGIERFRISSIEPNLLIPEIIDFVLKSQKYCNHFHIPLQSGSDHILKSMRRRYLTAQYRELVDSIKGMDRDAAIGADVIVGYPGEDDRCFRETFDFLHEIAVSYLHVFTYSERHNTPAATYPGRVEPRVRFGRSERLRILGIKKRNAFMSPFIGQALPVLFEGGSARSGRISGLTTNYIRVEVDGGESLTNSIHPVKLIAVEGVQSSGILCNQQTGIPTTEELTLNG